MEDTDADLEIVDVKLFDHLPLVSACMRYLEIAKTIDEIVPSCMLSSERV